MNDLILEQVTKGFGDHVVLQEFSARFPGGQCTCIMGPSGCGKTTLLRLILGLEQPDSGRILGQTFPMAAVFQENRARAFQIWREPFTELRIPLLFNLRRDPVEKAQIDANTYNDWFLDRAYVLVPMQQIAGKFYETMAEYPPSQTPGSFNLEKIQKQLEDAARGK